MQVFTFLYRIANCSLYDRSSCESIAYGRSTGIYPFIWRLIDSLVVYPEHHFLDAVDQSLDGA